jgi:hypothetical protein
VKSNTKENLEKIEHCVPTVEKIEKTGNIFSLSYSKAQQRGHKYMAIQRDTNFKDDKKGQEAKSGGKMLSFNQIKFANTSNYNYHLPSADQFDKQAGCSMDICKDIYKLPHELWAVYQLYK